MILPGYLFKRDTLKMERLRKLYERKRKVSLEALKCQQYLSGREIDLNNIR